MAESEHPAREFAMQLFDALRAGEWRRAAAMYDQTELANFRRLQLEQFLGRLMHERPNAEDLVPYITDPFLILPQVASRAIAEWPPPGTIQQLVDLSPIDFFAAYLEVMHEAFRDVALPRLVAAIAIERSDLIHVLYRRDQEYLDREKHRFTMWEGAPPPWMVRVLSVRCTGSVLGALPNAELSGRWLTRGLSFIAGQSTSDS